MEYRFARIGKTGSQSMFDYIYNLAELKPEAVWPEFVWIIAVVVSFGSIFIMRPLACSFSWRDVRKLVLLL